MGGNSSPSRHTGILITDTSELDPTNGTGATNIGTTTGGKIVIRMKSPVFIIKSADTATPRKTTTHTYIKIAAHPV
jgi:hypothetical protein